MSLDLSARHALEVLADEGQALIETQSAAQVQRQYLSNFAKHQRTLEAVADSSETQVDKIRTCIWRGIGAPITGARAILYLHGGGWVIGSPETHEDICRSIASRAQAVVFSPDYALAPDRPFPAGLNDCTKVLADLTANAEAYGIDPKQIAIGGDSAGGNLAAVLAIMARDGTVPAVTAQLMFYPVTDCRQITESYVEKADGFGLSAAAMAWFLDHYLRHSNDRQDWRASPLLVPSLAGVAPGFIALTGQDVLLSEGEAYGARLEAEASCIVRRWPGQIHGIASLRGLIPEGDDAIDALIAAWNHFAPQR